MKPIGATMAIVVAIFFLVVANGPIRFCGHGGFVATRSMGCGPIILGLTENIDNNDVHEGSFLVANIEKDLGIINMAIVYTNITEDSYFVAIYNNSRLNAKTHVFVIAMDNIIVNGVRLNTSDSYIYRTPFPNSLTISNGSLSYVVVIRLVASLDDIEDSDRPVNDTAQYQESDLLRIAIVGVPSVLLSLGFSVAIIAFIKELKHTEGLPDEL